MKNSLSIIITILNFIYVSSNICPELSCFKGLILDCHILKEGGQGVVFKVLTSRGVKAIKQMDYSSNVDEEEAQHKRQFYEYRAALYSELMEKIKRKTNIMKIEGHETNQREKVFCLMMDYIDGVELQSYLKKHVSPSSTVLGWLSEKFFEEDRLRKKKIFLRLFRCMVDSIATLNSKGFYHGDVNPNNFMVDKNGDCILIDFDSMVNNETNLQLFSPAITIAFAAPEIISLLYNKDHVVYDELCDLDFSKKKFKEKIYSGRSLSKVDSFSMGIFLNNVLFNISNPFFDEDSLEELCKYESEEYFFQCVYSKVYSIYFREYEGNLMNDKGYNHKILKSLNNYDNEKSFNDLYLRYLENNYGQYKIDFTISDLDFLFKTLAKLVELDPEKRLSLEYINKTKN
jgi:serine/threonine protein kinase